MSDADGESYQCELCGRTVNGLTLTGDSHPEGPNHLVGRCCAA